MIIYLGAPNYIRGTISVSWIRVYSAAAAATAGRISRCERFRAPRDESESVARFLDKSPRREKYKGTQPATVIICLSTQKAETSCILDRDGGERIRARNRRGIDKRDVSTLALKCLPRPNE